jgi:putative two-component system response regulator
MDDKPRLLVVDDTQSNLEVLLGILSEDYDVRVALDGDKALRLMGRIKPHLILLDVMMPVMDGYEVCRRIRQMDDMRDVPILFLTACTDDESETVGLSLGAVDYIIKPFNPEVIKFRIRNQLEFKQQRDLLKRHRDQLAELVDERTHELRRTLHVMLASLGALAEYRDNETGGHIRRTQHLVRLLAQSLARKDDWADVLTESMVDHLTTAAPLHDIGKVGIRDHILRKPGRLTEEEAEEMRRHTRLGYEVLKSATAELNNDPLVEVAAELARSHHEKWDGSGYPEGLKGNEIPLGGRLMAVADVYDALVSDRVYKSAMPHGEAVSIITAGRGTHFDPVIVDVFMELESTLPDLYRQLES